MKSCPSLRTGLLMAALYPLLLNATAPLRGTLHLDGILVLRGERGAAGRVVIIPLDAQGSVMEGVEGRFSADLSLDHAYLLSFERMGMVTKQIYFDTSVPVERHASAMEFPFKVTLNPEGKDGVYAYAGPVGIVRYIAAIDDFGYETDYTLRPGALFADRIIQLMVRSSVEPPAFAHGVPSAAVSRSAHEGPIDVMNTRAPLVRSEAPMVNRILHAGPADVTVPVMPNVAATDPVPSMPVDALGTRVEEVAAVLPEERTIAPEGRSEVHASPILEEQIVVREELIVDERHVTTLIWITGPHGQEIEYRRVADGRGTVVYFQDGLSIPAYVYQLRTGR